MLMMGCSFSQDGLDVKNPRAFKVYNVDDNGQQTSEGWIEITPSELILFQRHKDAIRWPLRGLRRYGYDAQLFSFESGRHCPTGHGYYSFRCPKAEALFNLLQESLQRASGNQLTMPNNNPDVNALSYVTMLQREPSYLIDNHMNGGMLLYRGARPLNENIMNSTSAISNNNNNNDDDEVGYPEYINTTINSTPEVEGHNYVNPTNIVISVDSLQDSNTTSVADSGIASNVSSLSANGLYTPNHVNQATYVNVNASDATLTHFCDKLTVGSSKEDCHSYANIDLQNANASAVSTPPIGQAKTKQLHYIQLDIHQSQDSLCNGMNPPSSPISLSSSNPESPVRKQYSETQSYAQIDFHRTAALSNSARTPHYDEGPRKTRHDSNIEDIT